MGSLWNKETLYINSEEIIILLKKIWQKQKKDRSEQMEHKQEA